MILVRPSVCASVPVCPKYCPCNSSYIDRRIDMNFCRLYSDVMKMCMFFCFCFLLVLLSLLLFVSAVFEAVMALAVTDLVPATPATSFIKLI